MSVESGSEIGYLYCLSNPAMPGLVKIGYTNRHTAIRAEELSFGSRDTNATGVPLPFNIEKDWRVPAEKAFEIEQLVHKRLQAHRVASQGKWKAKEFFYLVPSDAIERIEDALKELDWWSVAQAQQARFDVEVRALEPGWKWTSGPPCFLRSGGAVSRLTSGRCRRSIAQRPRKDSSVLAP
ncbi:MAG: GIY-YIG nuclease family protein [Rhodoferax sp.]|nr:GIY-YIG nuclease family protein [Rhodoferax sp.]